MTQSSWDNYLESTAAVWGTLYESGPRGRISAEFNGYDFPNPTNERNAIWDGTSLPWGNEISRVSGYQNRESFLLGYELVSAHWSLLGLVGGDLSHGSFLPADLTSEFQGAKWGLKTVVEFDSHPTDKTMLYSYGSYSTAFHTAEFEIKPGYLAFDHLSIGNLSIGKLYIGPHAAFFSDSGSQTWKVGAHLTATKIGPLHASVAFGYAQDSLSGSGAYGMLETWLRF